MLIMFVAIFVADTKIIFVTILELQSQNQIKKNPEVTSKELNQWKQKKLCKKKEYWTTLYLS